MAQELISRRYLEYRVVDKITDLPLGRSEVKGHITQTSENGFTLANEKTGLRTDIAYTDVLALQGIGMSNKKKIAIASAIGIGALITAVALALRDFDIGPITIR